MVRQLHAYSKLGWSGRVHLGQHGTLDWPSRSSRAGPRRACSGSSTASGGTSSRGERLLYEEGEFGLRAYPTRFKAGDSAAFSRELTGVEVIGGPYLHASLTTNFTQFGEGKLFGQTDWDRDRFVKYARLYRPSAIFCWSPHARFCRQNPDLIKVLEDDGVVLIGRVLGFEGDMIEGAARSRPSPGQLGSSDAPGLDGSVVLRYHSVPCLRTSPSVARESVSPGGRSRVPSSACDHRRAPCHSDSASSRGSGSPPPRSPWLGVILSVAYLQGRRVPCQRPHQERLPTLMATPLRRLEVAAIIAISAASSTTKRPPITVAPSCAGGPRCSSSGTASTSTTR